MLARVRGEFPARSAGDAGMVPLSSPDHALLSGSSPLGDGGIANNGHNNGK